MLLLSGNSRSTGDGVIDSVNRGQESPPAGNRVTLTIWCYTVAGGHRKTEAKMSPKIAGVLAVSGLVLICGFSLASKEQPKFVA